MTENMEENQKQNETIREDAKPQTVDASKTIQPQLTSKKNGRNRLLIFFTVLLLIIAVSWFLLWFFIFRFYEWTDDAYAKGNMISLNSAISGSVIAFYADDTDLVEEGQLIVKLDETKYQAVYDEALAALASTVLQVRQLYDTIAVNEAAVNNKSTALKNATYDYENRSRLISSKAISNEDFIHSKNTFLIAQYEFKQAQSQLQVSRDAVGNTLLENHPLIEEKKGRIRSAYYDLKHCSIYAPATGYIAQRFLDVGEWVTPNTAMMSVIPIDYVWVDANYKETQLAKMRIGQPATITFDLYGSKVVFKGKVLGIAFGTGSVFSLIPPQNATGNWIKIVQRLPVRISLDPEMVRRYPIRLGITAEVEIDLTNQDLPMIAQIPATKSIGTTSVFNIHLEEVEKSMADIIESHLKIAQP